MKDVYSHCRYPFGSSEHECVTHLGPVNINVLPKLFQWGKNVLPFFAPYHADYLYSKRGFATSTIITSLVGTFGNEELPDVKHIQ